LKTLLLFVWYVCSFFQASSVMGLTEIVAKQWGKKWGNGQSFTILFSSHKPATNLVPGRGKKWN
jgi:hypothetical protein